jgi:tetratricopeptide (TPR) repeat protein
VTASMIVLELLNARSTSQTYVFAALTFIIGLLLIWYLKAEHPNELQIRRDGLDALLAGRPQEAEKLFRLCLLLANRPEPVRAMVCLADALMDQGRYQESKAYLDQALALGDPTGSGQISTADLLLITSTDPARAIEMADKGLELTTSPETVRVYFDREVADELKLAQNRAKRARAKSQLGNHTEAVEEVDLALRAVESAEQRARRTKPQVTPLRQLVGSTRLRNGRELAIAKTHWDIGLALLAVGESGKAVDHFRVARNTDNRGKYRQLAQGQLEKLEAES